MERLGGLVVIAPARRAGEPGSNRGPGENFSFKLFKYVYIYIYIYILCFIHIRLYLHFRVSLYMCLQLYNFFTFKNHFALIISLIQLESSIILEYMFLKIIINTICIK